jgi:putative ABC transport system permease protein
MTTIGLDLRFALRTYRRHAVTTVLALVTLALGIGLNTAIFSVVNGILLKPLPYPGADRLVDIASSAPRLGYPRFSVSGPDLIDWQARGRHIALAGYHARRADLGGIEPPRSVTATDVTGSFFGILAVPPRFGRFITPEDCRLGAHVAVVSESFWHAAFGGDPRIVGRVIRIEGETYTVIGVAPTSIDLPPAGNLWLPFPDQELRQFRASRYIKVVGRVAPITTVTQAQAELSGIAAALARQYPDQDAAWGVLVQPLIERVVAQSRSALTMLSLAVWLVLAIACANVAGLLLARLAARSQELAIRTALGAGATRLTAQILVECVALFAIGGGLGLLVASAVTRALGADTGGLPRLGEVAVDGRVLGYCAGVALGVSLLVGFIVARAALADNVASTLREGRKGGAGGTSRRVRRGLVIGQVALAMTLLSGSGLLVRSLLRLTAVDPGFRAAGVTTVPFSLWSTVAKNTSGAHSDDTERGSAVLSRALAALASQPGVRQVAAIYPLPLSGQDQYDGFVFADRPLSEGADAPHSAASFVAPETFGMLHIPLVGGRDFGNQDTPHTAQVAIVNQAFAKQFWPGQNAVGQRLSFDVHPPAGTVRTWCTVIGVVGDIRADSLDTPPESTIYRSLLQVPRSSTLLVAGDGSGGAPTVSIQKALRSVDPDVPLDRVRRLLSIADEALAERRLRTILLTSFAALAALLAGVGLYGLLSDLVTQRTHEVGVRMALGAARAEVRTLVLRQGMTMVGWGLLLGFAGSFALGVLLKSQLFGVHLADPLALTAAALSLALVGILANWFPALRATEVDPIEALRAE